VGESTSFSYVLLEPHSTNQPNPASGAPNHKFTIYDINKKPEASESQSPQKLLAIWKARTFIFELTISKPSGGFKEQNDNEITISGARRH
jgi:hypothetical protein